MRSFPLQLQRRPSALLLTAALAGGTIARSLAAQQPASASQARPLTLAQALEIAERNSETVGIAREELARA
ncbi:MAG TPA: hypothetical protein VKB22_02050, partial [Gemmatimonadales bacterium]|nr:hypothetical protein [Gemmatimonadales bacterium]